MALHNQERNVEPHFNCLEVRNAMVPLMMLLELCDAGENGVTGPRETCCISFQLFWKDPSKKPFSSELMAHPFIEI